MLQYLKGRADLALMGYLQASELGYEKGQANAAWILSQDEGIPSGQSATSYVKPGTMQFQSAHALSQCLSILQMVSCKVRLILLWQHTLI